MPRLVIRGSLTVQPGWLVSSSRKDSTKLIFLGIYVDTQKMQLHVPLDKMVRLRAATASWSHHRPSQRKRDLLSLIGRLDHAAKVVRPGHAFIRRLIDRANTVSSLEHHIRLNSAAKQDLGGTHSWTCGTASTSSPQATAPHWGHIQ